MLPPAIATELKALGHEALAVAESDLVETGDEDIYALAIDEQRVLVTENFADFADLVDQRLAREDPCSPVVFVRKRDFPRGGALAFHLARHLDTWARANPDPYPGLHWP